MLTIHVGQDTSDGTTWAFCLHNMCFISAKIVNRWSLPTKQYRSELRTELTWKFCGLDKTYRCSFIVIDDKYMSRDIMLGESWDRMEDAKRKDICLDQEAERPVEGESSEWRTFKQPPIRTDASVAKFEDHYSEREFSDPMCHHRESINPDSLYAHLAKLNLCSALAMNQSVPLSASSYPIHEIKSLGEVASSSSSQGQQRYSPTGNYMAYCRLSRPPPHPPPTPP